jgi:hypothetical protein
VSVRSDLIPELARRCAAVDPVSTQRIILDAAEQELRSGCQFAARAAEIPVEWWTNGEVAARVAAWALNDGYQASARADLLEVLTLRSPETARPIAAAWSELTADGCEVTRTLRQAGLECRMILDPESALPLVEIEFNRRGTSALEQMRVLYGNRRNLHLDLSTWPVGRLEALAQMLLRGYPVQFEPQPVGRIIHMTTATELCATRDRVVGGLLAKASAESNAALDRLAALDAGLARWLQDYRVRCEARALVGALPAPPDDQSDSRSAIVLSDAVRLLDQADYRLVRSDDDLLEVVCAVLDLIERDVAEDLPLLYGKPPRKDGEEREHLNEDALQAYIRRRLTDLLPARVHGARVEILREDQVRYRRRLDLRIVAPCRYAQQLATVVVEAKWSDNAETETSLTEQLGKNYLLGQQLTRGVYLVGWCGHWKAKGKPRQTDRADLIAYLTAQRDRYCQRDAGSGLCIRPVVLDLRWREEPNTA